MENSPEKKLTIIFFNTMILQIFIHFTLNLEYEKYIKNEIQVILPNLECVPEHVTLT